MARKKPDPQPPVAHVLCIDGHNFLHRSRSADIGGNHDVSYVFFRSLRSLIEKMKPTRVYFVLEGIPQKRLAAFPEYKGNRKVLVESVYPGLQPGDEVELVVDPVMEAFHRQKGAILDLLHKHFPITLLRHPHYECDDVIGNIVSRSSASVPWTIVSNDTDFIQLLAPYPHVKLFDPMRGGRYVEAPPCDYVKLKSLTGDESDNIPGIKGVGPKTALKMLADEALMTKKCLGDPELKALYERNQELIRFHDWKDEELLEVESSTGTCNWDAVKGTFDEWAFASITADDAWATFTRTFDRLWPAELVTSA
jgi:5'-3' exonuclease